MTRKNLTYETLLESLKILEEIPKPKLFGKDFDPSNYDFILMDNESFNRGIEIWENQNRIDTEPTFMGIPIKIRPGIPHNTIYFIPNIQGLIHDLVDKEG